MRGASLETAAAARSATATSTAPNTNGEPACEVRRCQAVRRWVRGLGARSRSSGGVRFAASARDRRARAWYLCVGLGAARPRRSRRPPRARNPQLKAPSCSRARWRRPEQPGADGDEQRRGQQQQQQQQQQLKGRAQAPRASGPARSGSHAGATPRCAAHTARGNRASATSRECVCLGGGGRVLNSRSERPLLHSFFLKVGEKRVLGASARGPSACSSCSPRA